MHDLRGAGTLAWDAHAELEARVRSTGTAIPSLFELAHAMLMDYSKVARRQIKTDHVQHIEFAAADLCAKRAALQEQLLEIDRKIVDCKAGATGAADASAAQSMQVPRDREAVSVRIIAEKGRQEKVCEECGLYFDIGSVCEVAGCDHHLECPQCDPSLDADYDDENTRIRTCVHYNQRACTRHRDPKALWLSAMDPSHWAIHKLKYQRKNSNRCGYYETSGQIDSDSNIPEYECGWTIWEGHCGKALSNKAGTFCSICEWENNS
jgi:hypothetical protein